MSRRVEARRSAATIAARARCSRRSPGRSSTSSPSVTASTPRTAAGSTAPTSTTRRGTCSTARRWSIGTRWRRCPCRTRSLMCSSRRGRTSWCGASKRSRLFAVSPQRRSALVSVAAAAALVVLKLSVGLATHSLGLVSEAAHSGTDLVAALLTYFAIRVASRPADVAHQFGHGKAEHLSALAEAGFLVLVSLFISERAIEQLIGSRESNVHVPWYALIVILVVIAIDASRTVVSWRTARLYRSPALASNALHFGSDLLGSLSV